MKGFTLENIRNFTFQEDVFAIYIALFIAFTILHVLARKKVNFSIRTVIALALGLVIGVSLTYIINTAPDKITTHIAPFVTGFKRLFMVIVIPLITVTIIKSFTSLSDTIQLRRIGIRTLSYLLGTTALATIIGIIVASAVNIGKGFPIVGGDISKVKLIPNFTEVLLNMLPSNIIQDMASGNVLPVIVMAGIISLAVIIEGTKHKESIKPFIDFIDSFATIMIRVTKMILRTVPYGILVIMINATARNGINTLKSLAFYIMIVYAVMIIHFVVVQLGLITFVAKLNPINFIKKIAPLQLFAFSTQSSYATLPVTISTLTRNVGVSNKIAGFVSPLGANVGMNACGGIYPAIVAIFVANAYHVDLGFSHYLIMVLTTTVSSIGIAGVPGIATLSATVVLTSLGLPLEGLALVLGVDALIDMGRTAINVTGTAVVATIVAVKEKDFDYNIFNDQTEKLGA